MNNETNHNSEPDQEIPLIDTEKSDQNQTDQQKRDTRIQQIDQELAEFSVKAQTEDEINAIQAERDQEYQNKILELETSLGQSLSEETKTQIHQNMVGCGIEAAKKDNERLDKLLQQRAVLQTMELFGESEEEAAKRWDNFKEGIEDEDYKTSLRLLRKNRDLFNAKGKLLHATNSFALNNTLEDGKLSGGLWQQGPSFAIGGTELALSFILTWEDLKIKQGTDLRYNPKKINSDKYFNKKNDVINGFAEVYSGGDPKKKQQFIAKAEPMYKEQWDVYVTEEKFDKNLKDKLYGGLQEQWRSEGKSESEITTRTEKFLKRAELFRKQICNRPSEDQIDKMFPITLAFKQDNVPEIHHQGELTDVQKIFEVRADEEVNIERVSTIFAPLNNMKEIEALLEKKYPDPETRPNYQIRPSEELEILRMLQKSAKE